MDVQRSHFRRNLSITLVLLFVLTLAALSYATWAVERGHLQGWEMLANVLIISLPLLLIYGAVYVLLMGWHERSQLGKVSPGLAKIIHWAPRLAAMLVLLILAWKRPVVGFVVFLVVALAFILFFVRDIYALTNLVLFVLPLLLVASLFYADWGWLAL